MSGATLWDRSPGPAPCTKNPKPLIPLRGSNGFGWFCVSWEPKRERPEAASPQPATFSAVSSVSAEWVENVTQKVRNPSPRGIFRKPGLDGRLRSEEHTSELQ